MNTETVTNGGKYKRRRAKSGGQIGGKYGGRMNEGRRPNKANGGSFLIQEGQSQQPTTNGGGIAAPCLVNTSKIAFCN